MTDTRPTASARSNGFGYKAVMIRNGRTKIVNRTFKTREEAIAYAEKYIALNFDR